MQRLDPDVAKVKTLLSEMKEPYSAILDVKNREKLPATALNKSFVQFLVGKGLIIDKKSTWPTGEERYIGRVLH